MNKQELIEKIKEIPRNEGFLVDTIEINKTWLLRELKQLELEKVKVSEEEAKFLETFNFSHDSDVTKALYYVSRTGFCHYLKDNFDIELKGLSEGFRDLENRKRLIRAILDGYEVEKEPKYTVMVKGVSGYGRYLNKVLLSKEYFFASENEVSGYRVKHTRKELEEDNFGWVFDCPGIEIEEVKKELNNDQ